MAKRLTAQEKTERWVTSEVTSTFWIKTIEESFSEVVLDEEDVERKIWLIQELLAEFQSIDIFYGKDGFYGNTWNNYDGIRFTINNSKLKGGYLITNLSPALICHSSRHERCDNCECCYAKADERRHKHSAFNNLNNMMVVLDKDPKESARELAEKLTDGQKEKIFWHRVNVNGEYWSPECLKWAVAFCEALYEYLPNLLGTYSYTHNKDLIHEDTGCIVMNWSFNNPHGTKRCITARKYDDCYLDSSKYAVCNGNCMKCSYCKDPNETRIIVFFEHGTKHIWKDEVPKWHKFEFAVRKWIDWLKFANRMGFDPYKTN